MADSLATLAGPVALSAGDNTLFTVPASHKYTIVTMTLINTNAASRTVKVGIGGSADAKLIVPPVPLAQYEQIVSSEKFTIAAGGTLVANTSNTGITATVSGLDQT